MTDDTEVLTSLNTEELRALAESNLAPSSQNRLDELLARNQINDLHETESEELDRLLAQVDHLNILKARARLTLNQQANSNP